jgi:hypothetical protein
MNSPTITEVLARFLAEQKQRVSPRTFAPYRDVVELLQHHLNGYGYESLNELETRRFERARATAGESAPEFCDLFGPEHILPNLREFLSYFMIRKVMASRSLLQAAGSVTRRLAGWLAEQGYAEPQQAEAAAVQSAEAARKLPRANQLASRLQAHAELQLGSAATDQIEDHFRITRVEPGRIWLEGLIDGQERGPIQLPEALSRQCPVGWRLSGVIGRIGRRWQLIDVWNVYPL